MPVHTNKITPRNIFAMSSLGTALHKSHLTSQCHLTSGGGTKYKHMLRIATIIMLQGWKWFRYLREIASVDDTEKKQGKANIKMGKGHHRYDDSSK